jgi:3'-phosphoadenosine 5'-phosphosulfate synthase
MTIEQATAFVIKHMNDESVLGRNSDKRVVQSLVRSPTAEEAAEHETLPSVEVDEHQVQYLQTIGDGWAFPLTRFMNEIELLESMQMKTVTDNEGKRHLLSVPITMHLTAEKKAALGDAKKFAIKYKGVVYATISEPVYFENRKEEICSRTFGTFSPEHAGAQPIMAQGEWLVSGASMHFTKRVTFDDGMDMYRYTPSEIADQIKARGADAVYAFQVRNPLHNGHVLLLKDTREQLLKQGFKNPILLLHPLGGWCKDDDVPLDTRMYQHQALLDDGTLNPEHTILAVWPSPMYYGGPTEVLWHASSRVGCGISHFITGRDPAGVKHPVENKDCYDVWHGQKLLVHMKQML